MFEKTAAPGTNPGHVPPRPIPQPAAAAPAVQTSAPLFIARPTIDAPVTGFKTGQAPYERRVRVAAGQRYASPLDDVPGIRTITFATDHLIEIELALEDRIEKLQKIIDGAVDGVDCMSLRDSLDVTRQALELVR